MKEIQDMLRTFCYEQMSKDKYTDYVLFVSELLKEYDENMLFGDYDLHEIVDRVKRKIGY